MAQALTNLQWYVDAYGFGALSTPLFVQPDETFRFRPTAASADTFFDAARSQVNVRNAGSYQSFFGGGLGLTGQIDLIALQQYLTDLRTYRADAATVSDKQRLLNEAAYRQYEAAMQAIQTLNDPAEREKKKADALRELASNLSGPAASASVKQPAAPAMASGADATIPPTSELLAKMAAVQGLYAGGTPGVSNEMRSALLMAAGDNATYAILSLLGEPDKMSKFTGQKVLFGVSTVSVNPGWLTQKGFAADVSTRVSVSYVPARAAVRKLVQEQDKLPEALKACLSQSLSDRSLETETVKDWCHQPSAIPDPYDREELAPYVLHSCQGSDLLVAAVSPMSDAQLMDSQSALRRQRELAMQIKLALSYAGAKVAADTFAKWAEQQQQDIQSRGANVVVNAYSSSGGVFGFQVGPRLGADPELKDKKASTEKLVRQSFPTLLIMGFDPQTPGPKVLVRTERVNESTTKAVCNVVEPELIMQTSTRWQPLNKKAARLSEEEYFALRASIDRAFVNLQDADGKAKEKAPQGEQYKLATEQWKDRQLYRDRWQALLARLDGTGYSTTLPIDVLRAQLKDPCAKCEPPPAVEAMTPGAVELAVETTGRLVPKIVELALMGSDLEKIDTTKVTLSQGKASWVNEAGAVQAAPVVKRIGGSLVLRVRVEEDTPLVFALPVKDSAVVVKTPPFLVRREPERSITIERKAGTKDETYRFPRGTSDDVIRATLQKDTPTR
jgi:hypothetical protein